VVILRAGERHELALLEEIEQLTAQRGGKVITLVGSREKHRLDAATLWSLVPDLRSREAYVCGPTEFVDTVTVALGEADLPEQAIHHEAYALW
jgi:ferredoxin-NADP reductase